MKLNAHTVKALQHINGPTAVSAETINLIENNAVKSRSFAKLGEKTEADHLQTGPQVFQLRNEGFSVLTEKSNLMLHMTTSGSDMYVYYQVLFISQGFYLLNCKCIFIFYILYILTCKLIIQVHSKKKTRGEDNMLQVKRHLLTS